MPKPTGLGTYTDVQEVADLVLAHRGGKYECNSYSAAVHFTHRFYKFRQLYRKIHGEPCKYDPIIAKRVAKGDRTIHFKLRQHVGTFTPADSSATDISSDDPLFDIASDIAKKLREGE